MDWKALGALAAIGGAIVALHGITNKKWSEAHTLFVLLAAIAYFGPRLQDLTLDL